MSTADRREMSSSMNRDQFNSVPVEYRFKTPEGQAEFMAAYDRTMARWLVPHEVVFVPTRLGATHVLVSGPEDAPPLVLLHGISMNSTIWLPNVAALSQYHRVYLVDIVGLPNRSGGRPPRTRQEAVEWLRDVLDGLGIETCHLGGFSFGGFLTLNFAMAAPERVQSIIPMACGLGGFRWLPLIRSTVGLIWTLWRPTPPRITGLWRNVSASDEWIEDVFVDQAYLGWKHIKLARGVLPFGFRDHELRTLSVPTLLLEGEQTPVYSAQSALDRAENLVPDVRTEMIHDAGEMLTIEQPEAVNRAILSFLEEQS